MGTQMELLTNEHLCNLAQAGGKQALELLIQNNLPFIQQAARIHFGQNSLHPAALRRMIWCRLGLSVFGKQWTAMNWPAAISS